MFIKPYGDTKNDGKVQISFSLPIANNAIGMECAKALAKQMGLIDPQVVASETLGDNFSFYIIYGSIPFSVEPEKIHTSDVSTPTLSKEEIEALIEKELQRDIVFIGASTGS
ncbi:MAG TPA: OAM dimerization domain-containing protein, partial [Bacilli bacterium]|nr:OAM dimerization domain-containing protein [Bacilli bacterium]